MYRVVPLSLIEIHFVGSPLLRVSGPNPSPIPLKLRVALDKAEFVVSKVPPLVVIPPLAVSSPVSVVGEVTARVPGMEKAPPLVAENSVEPELLVPFVTMSDPFAVPT